MTDNRQTEADLARAVALREAAALCFRNVIAKDAYHIQQDILALLTQSAADALADREAAIHHSYQCGEAYGRLVSAQVDLIVAERMQEAVQPFAEALEALVGKVAESSRRSQVMWLPDIGEVWKARDLLAAHRAAVGAQEKK